MKLARILSVLVLLPLPLALAACGGPPTPVYEVTSTVDAEDEQAWSAPGDPPAEVEEEDEPEGSDPDADEP